MRSRPQRGRARVRDRGPLSRGDGVHHSQRREDRGGFDSRRWRRRPRRPRVPAPQPYSRSSRQTPRRSERGAGRGHRARRERVRRTCRGPPGVIGGQDLGSGGSLHLLWWGIRGGYEVPDLPEGDREGGEVEGAAGVYVGEDLQGTVRRSLVGFDPCFDAFVGGSVFWGFADYLRGEQGVLVEDVVAQGRASEGAPAVVAGEHLDVAAQPVEPQPNAKDEVDGRGRIEG